MVDAFRSSCARQVPSMGPNTPGLRVNSEAAPMVAHELIGGYCYIHALMDEQGRDMAKRRGIGSKKIHLVRESRCAAESLSGSATIIRNLKLQATFKRMWTPRSRPTDHESRK